MSKKRKGSAARKPAKLALDRPFDPAVWARAGRVAERYGFLVQPNEEVGFLARGLEMPNVFADGATAEDCVRSIREALTVATATMIEQGESPPSPADESVRREQINVRVTPEEKLRLEEAARSKGFRGISDFVRSTSLSSIR
jgi:predicted RNase H-like HicB family nuclease